MSLIKSISGTRGTIGGRRGENLTPFDIVEATTAFGQLIKNRNRARKVVIGRDARVSGQLVSNLASSALRMMGIDVIDLGLSTTPTVEIAVPLENAGGGIIFTASHNPAEWNALKFLNEKGEFISNDEGKEIIELANSSSIEFSGFQQLGKLDESKGYILDHINLILGLDFIDTDAIREMQLKVVVDCINSTGALAIPPLLDKFNVKYHLINSEMNGEFAHNPEPLPNHLMQLSEAVILHKADLGIAVDPDVDRLALICEDGSSFGEEYTLVAVADYILSRKQGVAVSNLSSSRALSDICRNHNAEYAASAVGEVNVVKKMKEMNAVIGGEGNGGVIVPELHFGRDALAGIALILALITDKKQSLSAIRKSYPDYHIIKDKIPLEKSVDIEAMLDHLKLEFQDENLNTIDGLKIDFKGGWVHLRKSNTEPIIRIYAESQTVEKAKELIDKVYNKLA